MSGAYSATAMRSLVAKVRPTPGLVMGVGIALALSFVTGGVNLAALERSAACDGLVFETPASALGRWQSRRTHASAVR